MFEKEAEDSFKCKKVLYKYETDKHSYIDGFKDGAEFGHNKANEWHFVKDGDLPKVGQKCYFIYSNLYGKITKLFFQNLVLMFLQVFTLLFLTKKQVTKQQKLVFMTI